MSFLTDLFKDRTRMITPDRALPGRDREMPVPERHFVLGTPLRRRSRTASRPPSSAMGCFWGAERVFWQAPGRLHDGGRLRRRLHAEPDLRGGLLGLDRPHRGGAGGLRPGADELRGDPAPVLGEPRSDPGHAPGQRRRHAVPLGDLLRRRRASRRSRSARATPTRRCWRPPATARSPPRSRRRGRSTTPRSTTSSTWRRTRTATAGSAGPASAARSGSPRRASASLVVARVAGRTL